MQDALLVQVVYSDAGLEEKNEGLFLLHLLLFAQVEEKRAVFCVLQDQVHILVVLEGVEKLYYVRVLEGFLELYLTTQVLRLCILH